MAAAVMAVKVVGTTGKEYTVRKAGQVWTCSCDDHVYRSHGGEYVCRHIAKLAVDVAAFATRARKSAQAERIIEEGL